MRTLRDAVCLLVAVGSLALAAWQPAVTTDAVDPASMTGVAKPVDSRSPQPLDRAVLTAPLVRT